MFESFRGKKSGEWTVSRETIETERTLGRKTREEIGKGNQMEALRFLTGVDIRHPWPPFRVCFFGLQGKETHFQEVGVLSDLSPAYSADTLALLMYK